MQHVNSAVAPASAAVILLAGGLIGAAAPIDDVRPPSSSAPRPVAAPPQTAPPAPDTRRTSDPVAAVPAGRGNIWAGDPRLRDGRIAAADRLLEEGKSPECFDELRQAASENPTLPPPELLLTYLHLAKGRRQPAQAALEAAAVRNKQHPEVYLTAGQLALIDRRPLDAWLHFKQALQTPPPAAWDDAHRRGFAVTCFAALMDIAEQRRDWSEFDAVMRKWSEAQQLAPQQFDRWGTALFRAGRPEEAEEKFAAAFQADAKLNPPELSMAAMCMKVGDLKGADQWYRKAVERRAEDARVYFEFGGALVLRGEWDAAQVQLDLAAKQREQSEEVQDGLLLTRGFLARGRKEYEQAEALFRELLARRPGHFQALCQLPLVMVEQDDEAKREAAQRLALIHSQKHPQSADAQSTLGWVQHRLGDDDAAEQTLRAAARRPRSPETQFFLAQVLLKQGKAQDAEPAFRAVKAAIDRPGLFLVRDDARDWLETTSLVFP